MRPYFYISSGVVCLSLLIAMGNHQALTAKNSPTLSSNQPLKVLGVKLNTAKSQPKDKSTAEASWLDGLEVEIENSSGKPIRYLLLYVELSTIAPEETPLKIPFLFGQAPVPNTKSGKFEIFQPNAKLNLTASKNVCDEMRKQLLESGRVPTSSKDIQTDINVVIFEDKTAWLDGQLHYPDPANPMKWISAEELTRKNSLDSRAFGMSYSKASYNSGSSSQTCYRDTGFELLPCCGGLYVGSKILVEDPNGHVHPNLVEACCSPGDCCSYTEVAGGCA
ncbi:MAG TPA: hypothetical protein VFS90_11350 [Pyrinomonadaceae bacterium]|nr:hypothetical protein [Pyrinomonadaceae bacterium]